jgi:hypothetical protein
MGEEGKCRIVPSLKKGNPAECQRLMPVILATWEAEIG